MLVDSNSVDESTAYEFVYFYRCFDGPVTTGAVQTNFSESFFVYAAKEYVDLGFPLLMCSFGDTKPD
jgi:hypothetical protein